MAPESLNRIVCRQHTATAYTLAKRAAHTLAKRFTHRVVWFRLLVCRQHPTSSLLCVASTQLVLSPTPDLRIAHRQCASPEEWTGRSQLHCDPGRGALLRRGDEMLRLTHSPVLSAVHLGCYNESQLIIIRQSQAV